MIPQYAPTLHQLTKNDAELTSFTLVRNDAGSPVRHDLEEQELRY
jgi:hypothetical protein